MTEVHLTQIRLRTPVDEDGEFHVLVRGTYAGRSFAGFGKHKDAEQAISEAVAMINNSGLRFEEQLEAGEE